MRRTIAIHLGEESRPLGMVRYDQQGARESASFAYDAEWLASPDRFEIEPGPHRPIGFRHGDIRKAA